MDAFNEIVHCAPAHFERLADGSFWGYTELGYEFTQVSISNDKEVPLQKFTIGEAFFYVTDKGAIFADSDIQAVSMYFALTV